MPVIQILPAAPLNRYVECMWWSNRGEPQSEDEHLLPSGRVHLVIALHDAPYSGRSAHGSTEFRWREGVVHGPQRGYYVSYRKPAGPVVGVSFRPGCAGALLGVSAGELTDCHVPLRDALGSRGRNLRERLLCDPCPPGVFRVLGDSLMARIHAPLLMHPAIAHSLNSVWGSRPMASIRHESGYSARHFIELFSTAVGITPKHYGRIQRFNRAVRMLARDACIDRAALALNSGYSDQAHFSREFREFAGVTSMHYRGTWEAPLHQPAPAAQPAGFRR